jgi:hypothetical protein
MSLLALVWLGLALIDRVTKEDLSHIHSECQTFLLVLSSNSYAYSSVLEMFVRSIRRSQINAKFLYIDAYSEDLTAKDLGIPAVPGVLYLPCRQYFTGQIIENALVSFFNECTAGKIPHITKASDLQHFFDTCGFGVLIAYATASDATLPAVAEIHPTHFNEISIAYCDPALTGTSKDFFGSTMKENLNESN